MTEAARTLADKIAQIPIGPFAILLGMNDDLHFNEIVAARNLIVAHLRAPLPGTREEVARADREALEKIERRDVHWVSSFEAEGKIVLRIDELNMLSLVLGPAGEIARVARANRALPPAPMPEREKR